MTRKSKKSNYRILLVDDNTAVLSLLARLFADEGISTQIAESAGEARNLLEADIAGFDLVLSDISMPGETGFDLLQWIKANTSDRIAETPVLLTTAQLPEAEHRLRGLSLGAVDYVVRPVDATELVVRAVKAVENYRKIKSLEKSLADSENQAMVGRLMAASNHEIKNIVSLVKLTAGQVAGLVDRGIIPKDSREGQSLVALRESADLLTAVTRSIRGMLDPSSETPMPLNAKDLLTSTLRVMRQRLGHHYIACELNCVPDNSAWVTGSAVRIKQILINFLLNAGDAMDEAGEERKGGRIEVAFIPGSDASRIVVRDSGIGFRESGVRKEFRPFATTKKLRGGQGLGLWLSSRFAQDMGGWIELASEGPGLGAEASLYLRPAAPAPADDIDLEKYFIE